MYPQQRQRRNNPDAAEGVTEPPKESHTEPHRAAPCLPTLPGDRSPWETGGPAGVRQLGLSVALTQTEVTKESQRESGGNILLHTDEE